MATAPANDMVEPQLAGEIVALDPNEVEIGEDRLRDIDPVWAAAIGQSMRLEGQINAVSVVPVPGGRWKLVGPGGHRVTGARSAGIPVEARVMTLSDAAARRRESAENVFRRPNDPLERAAAVAELVRLHRERVGIDAAQSRSAKVKKGVMEIISMTPAKALQEEAAMTCDTMSHVYGWTEEVGATLGFTGRTIRNDLLLYRRLAPSVVGLLRENRHPLLRNAAQLRQLAKLEPGEQERVAARMIDQGYGAPKSVGDAVLLVRGTNRPVADPAYKRFNTILGTLARMDAKELRGLFQSPLFHDAIPAEAQQLLAPMRRDPEDLQ